MKKLLAPYEGAVSIKFPSANDTAAEITVRGPSDKAADCVRRIKEMVDEWKHQEIMCSFQEDVKLPKESARRILGQARSADENAGSAGGWIIRAVKEKVAAVGDKGHGVQITDRDINMTRFDITSSGEKGDVITITGHKRAVQLAKEIILERSQKLADTVVTSINIPSKFHSKLIGKGGKVVGKLMELYNVHVKFPSRTPANNGAAVEEGDEDEDKTIDEDKVTIRGFKADVEKAKAELLALAEYEEAHSHSLVFTVPAKLLPRIVGRKGQTVHLIKEDTDTRIDFDRSKVEEGEEGDLAGEVTVTVEGPKAGCEQAKKKIMEIVNEQLDIAEHHMAIPRRFHRVIIGHSGVAIRNLVAQWTEDFGLAADRIQVKFPKDEGDDVLIRAPSKVVEKVVGLLEAEVKKHEASMPALAEPVEGAERIEEEIQIPRTDVARVVGRKGETITGIAGNRGVDIQISQGKDDSDSPMVGVKISGYSQEAIDGAKTDILSKLRTVETMSIPSLVMPFIENDRGRLRGADAGGSVNFEGDQLVLRGDRASVDGVKAVVSKRLEELSKYTHSTSVVITSTVRPHVIGRQGATINRIRSESGCMVDIFPAEKVGQAKGQFAVVILGADEDGIRKAQAAVEKIVKDQLQSNTQGGAGGAGSGKDDGTVLKRINVPLRHHRRLIGPKGANIEEIRNRVGGPINLQFPRAGITSNEVEVRASASAIDKCVKVISDMIREWGDETAAAQIAIVSDAPAVAPAGAGPDREATRTPDSTKASSEAEPAPAGPPGWSGKSILKGARGMPPPAPSPVLIPEPSYLPPSGPAPKQGDDEWKVIGKKAKPSAVAAIDVVAGSGAVPGASGEGKSKKKKNKKTAAGAESTAPAASDSFTFAPASPVGNWADEVDVPSPVSAGANGVAATDPTPRSDDWQTVNTVQRFKQKKLEETGTGAAPAASAASGGARNAFGVLEEPAAPKTSSKKKK